VEPETILCICASGVGNAIMFTPVITNIRARYPKSRIVFMGSPMSVEVVRGSDLVDGVMEYRTDVKGRLRALMKVRSLKPDMVIVASSDRGVFISFLSWFSGASVRAGFVHKNRGIFYNRPLFIDAFFEKHEVYHNLDLCRILDIPIVSKRTFFAIGEDDERFASEWLKEHKLSGKPIVGLHPGSHPRYHKRRWSAERFGALASLLAERGFAVVVFGSLEEIDLFHRISEVEPSSVSAMGLGFKRSAAILRRCIGLVANDSGFMHMAYTLGVRVLGLFGPTSENHHGPLGTSAVITAPVPCRPCYRGQKEIECPHVRCMTEITVDKVADEFFRLIERSKAVAADG